MIKQTFDQFPEEMWVTAVQVATVWTNPESAREVDADGIANPTDIESWIGGLTYETNLALCDEDRVQTQLLYGEPVIITETTDEWAQVVVPSQPSSKDKRGYPGWVPLHQLAKVKKAEWKRKLTAAVVKDKIGLENISGVRELKLSYMTLLPIVKVEDKRVEVKTAYGNRYVSKTDVHIFPTEKGIEPGSGESIVKVGEQFIQLDYFWGGMSAFGYDCSGLAYVTHQANGYQIARDAGDQALKGKKVAFDQLESGDLLFFAYQEGKGKLHHVGIYYGNGKMLHSPQTGKGVEVITLKGTIYEKEFCMARRYWDKAGEKK